MKSFSLDAGDNPGFFLRCLRQSHPVHLLTKVFSKNIGNSASHVLRLDAYRLGLATS